MMASSRYPASATVRCERLRELRLAAGLEVTDLARKACLSVSQVQELEGAPGHGFYNHAIRMHAAARLARVLQVADTELIDLPPADEAAPAEPEELPDPVDLILPKAGRQIDGDALAARPASRYSARTRSRRVILLGVLAVSLVALGVSSYLR